MKHATYELCNTTLTYALLGMTFMLQQYICVVRVKTASCLPYVALSSCWTALFHEASDTAERVFNVVPDQAAQDVDAATAQSRQCQCLDVVLML